MNPICPNKRPALLALVLMVTVNTLASEQAHEMKEAVKGNSDFAFDLYSKLKDAPNTTMPKGNLFLSPYSISNCLAMVYGGARGETQRQMAEVLHFNMPVERLAQTLGTLHKQLIQEDKSQGYELLLANALWGRKGYPFLGEFLNLSKHYEAPFTQLDFVSETEQSRQVINTWVEEKTKEKIKELIPPDGIDEQTALVLTNSVYFKGEWKFKFIKSETTKGDFYVSAKDIVEVGIMYLEEDFKYYEDFDLQAIELPYKGDELSMFVLLPSDTEGIKEIENKLTTKMLDDLQSKMNIKDVIVYFPSFKITWGTFSLKEILIALGMKDAFEPGKADFSGINGKKDLWVSNVFHKAFVEVNEEGTEAAAATETTLELGGAPSEPTVFQADHPFIFIIKDNRSGSILFMGRVMNPRGTNIRRNRILGDFIS